MACKGRMAAVAYTLVTGTVTLGLAAWMNRSMPEPGALSLAAAFFLSLTLPAGWYLGLKYDKLKRKSDTDCLTGVGNRAFIVSCFPRLARQAGKRDKKMSVSIVDINDFKAINDTYGHQAGDQVLLMIADSLRGCAAKGEIVARWGGDEFLLVCPYGASRGRVSVRDAIENALERLSLRIGVRVSAAVGTAVFPDHGRTLNELVQAADQRMYHDKEVRKSENKEGHLDVLQA
ncbi:MAG TPA: GGDEF domain-containing protein [Paenibacillus sp.]|uniref:GGDEF domain-containing protein n=1 Tax=Paenibacillus sp. TaxID=58172 RepID=UPI0028D29DC8|nr:GGDEF domain-containing protein [Paenibacillus sp.]HUC92819.1 GGDEF domain-containing protein [Paenibacillus sp.]